MKVCHVINSLQTGGAEMMLCRLLEAIDDHFDNTVISLKDRGEIADDLEKMGIRVVVLGLSSGTSLSAACFQLWREIIKGSYDLVQTWMYHSDLIGGVVAKLAGIPVVWGIHNSNLSRKYSSRVTRAIVRVCSVLSYYIPTRIICCSVASKNVHAVKFYDVRKMVVIPNGFDVGLYNIIPGAKANLCSELSIPEKSFIVGMVARFDPQKDPRNFLRAAAKFGQINEQAHFVLCGKDFDQQNTVLGDWIMEFGLDKDRIHLLGIRRDIPQILNALDVFCLSSAYGEAFPLVIGEAMACGVPCVVTDVGDSATIVGDAGYVVPIQDPLSIANAWGRYFELSSKQKSQIKQRARQRILNNYSIERIASQYQEVYEQQ